MSENNFLQVNSNSTNDSKDNELRTTKNEYQVLRNENKQTPKMVYEKPGKVQKRQYSNEYIANFTTEKKMKQLSITQNKSKSRDKSSTIKSSKESGRLKKLSKSLNNKTTGFGTKNKLRINNYFQSNEFEKIKSEKYRSLSSLKGEGEKNKVKKDIKFNQTDKGLSRKSYGANSQESLKKSLKLSETLKSKGNTASMKDFHKGSNTSLKEGFKNSIKSKSNSGSKDNLFKQTKKKTLKTPEKTDFQIEELNPEIKYKNKQDLIAKTVDFKIFEEKKKNQKEINGKMNKLKKYIVKLQQKGKDINELLNNEESKSLQEGDYENENNNQYDENFEENKEELKNNSVIEHSKENDIFNIAESSPQLNENKSKNK